MTTKHPRLNVTLSPENMGLLALLAEKENKSLSMTASELIALALELEEDRYLSSLAAERETSHTGWVSHEDAWK